MKHITFTSNISGLLLIVVMSGLLGCTSQSNISPDFNRHDLKVRRVHDTHSLYFNQGSTKLTRAQQEKLVTEIGKFGVRGSQWVNIRAPRNDLSDGRVDHLYKLLVTSGAPEKNISVTYSKGIENSNRYDLRISKYGVILPSCSDWSAPSGHPYEHDDSSNFGCAQSYNLGMMLDDPRDLVEDQPMGAADGMKEEQAIKRYRTDKVKELPSVLLFNNSGGQ